jgi:hypothetical protein
MKTNIIILITVVLLTIVTAYSETTAQTLAHNEFLRVLMYYNSACEICQPADFLCQRRQLDLEQAVDIKAQQLNTIYPNSDLAPLAKAWIVATQTHGHYLAVWHNQPAAEMDERRLRQMEDALNQLRTSWEVLRGELQKLNHQLTTGQGQKL